MAVLSKQEFTDKWGSKFADNTIQDITEAVLRDFRQDIADSFADVSALRAPTAPDYDAGALYGRGSLVLFGLPKRFYQAKVPGLLPAPTPGQETTEWLPVAAPLSPLLPYREMPVLQGQDYSSDGLLEPSKLYRFTNRVEASGGALADVLVVAVSRQQVGGADAYTIGLDPQTRQEYLLPVSYELATDTTAPRAGGVGDAYTKAEADTLLAGKGSAPVQAQHTLQLKTLGVQASPAMAYLESGDVAGYGTLDEALADARPKTFMRFNVATVTLTASNDPAAPGWASYVDGAGATLELGANVVLSLPGSTLGTLLLKNFFLFQAPNTRGGRVELLATGNANTPPGQLPLLDGQCAVPLKLQGGAVALTGSFGSLIGTGTVHLYEPYDVGFIGPDITAIYHPTGSGTVKSLNGVGPDAAGNVALPQTDIYSYSQPKRDQVLALFTTPGQFKAVDVPLAGDTSTGLGSQLADLATGTLYLLVPDRDNPMPDPANPSQLIGTPTWLRLRSA
jgi:hypothetical protein